MADELVKAGIDPSRLMPAGGPGLAVHAAADRCRSGGDRLPQLDGHAGAMPAAASAPGSYSPYNLPRRSESARARRSRAAAAISNRQSA